MSTHTTILVTLAVYYVFSAAAGAMLPPTPGKENTLYGWAFRFIQALAANVHRLADSKLASLQAAAERRHGDLVHRDLGKLPAGSLVELDPWEHYPPHVADSIGVYPTAEDGPSHSATRP